ncbi:hypothetical protein Lser_V15G03258 [Lactuca serriola]
MCRLHELANKIRISVTGASKMLANILYSYRGMDSEGGRLKGLTNHLLSRHRHSCGLVACSRSPFKIVDGPSSSAVGNPDKVAKLFPSLFGQPSAILVPGESNELGSALKIGVVLYGGQAPGGHNVIYLGFLG